jgi:hypothetical protein
VALLAALACGSAQPCPRTTRAPRRTEPLQSVPPPEPTPSVAIAQVCRALDAQRDLETLARCIEDAVYLLQFEPRGTDNGALAEHVGRAGGEARRRGAPLTACERFVDDPNAETSALKVDKGGWIDDYDDRTEEVTVYRLTCMGQPVNAAAYITRVTPGTPF